jgi:hypothetical protein
MAEGNRWRVVPVRANGQLAFGHYIWRDERGAFVPHAIQVVTLDGDRIAGIVAFRDEEVVARFGLPEELSGPD